MTNYSVLQPDTFQQIRSELASMWSSDPKTRNPRRISAKSGILLPLNDASLVSDYKGSMSMVEDMENIRV